MASIYKRKDKEGKVTGWRAVVRIKGYPTVCNHFDRKQEAEDWAADVEREIKRGKKLQNGCKLKIAGSMICVTRSVLLPLGKKPLISSW
jgi:hypothetical protein